MCLTLSVQAGSSNNLHKYSDVSVELPNGNVNGRELPWELIDAKKCEWDLSFAHMGMGMGVGMKSLKWEEFGTKNQVPAHSYSVPAAFIFIGGGGTKTSLDITRNCLSQAPIEPTLARYFVSRRVAGDIFVTPRVQPRGEITTFATRRA